MISIKNSKLLLPLFFCVITLLFCVTSNADDVETTAPTLMTQACNQDISALAFSPDGKYLASVSGNAEIVLWETSTWNVLRRIHKETGTIHCAAFSRDNRFLAVAGSGYLNGIIYISEVPSGKDLMRIDVDSSVMCISFAQDGTLFTGHWNGTVCRWDLKSGKKISENKPGGLIYALCNSSDGKYVAVIDSRKDVYIWNTDTNTTEKISGRKGFPMSLAISPDDTYLAIGCGQTLTTVKLATGEYTLRDIPTKVIVSSAYSIDGKSILTVGADGICYINTITGEVKNIKCKFQPYRAVQYVADPCVYAFNPARNLLAWGSPQGAYISNIEAKGMELLPLGLKNSPVNSIKWKNYDIYINDVTRAGIVGWDLTAGKPLNSHEPVLCFSEGTKYLCNVNKQFMVKDFADSAINRVLNTGNHDILHSCFSKSGNYVALAWVEYSIGQIICSIYNTSTGELVKEFRFTFRNDYERSMFMQFTAKEDAIIIIRTSITVMDIKSAGKISSFDGHINHNQGAFSSTSEYLASSYGASTMLSVWKTYTGKLVTSIPADGIVMDISHDEKSVVLKYEKGQMVFASFPQLKKYAESVNPKIDSKPEKGLSSRTHFIEISPNDAFVAVMHFGVVNIFDIKSGKLLTTLSQSTSIGDFSISPDCRYVATSSQFDGIRIWEVKSGKLICTMMCFDDGTWAVVDPQGRYDASNAGDTTGLRWTIGDESVALRQLKDRYYEPNLLAKLMGFNDEPLRPVEGLDTVKLFPTVAVTPPAAGETKLGVSLTNRGGGIGTVLVLVNGKELTGDARGDMPDPTAATATLSVDLAQSAALMPGKENLVEVVAANADGTLTSRSVALTWTAPGAVVTTAPACYALIIGTSDYAGDTLDLRYAARDATAFAQAVQLGADRLFGVAETHLTLLTTDKDGIRPTKVAIQTAFTQIARQANPGDVLLVYIAGHGASLGRGQDTYCYLTCDARSAMDLADPVRRKLVAVTSAELQQWCARIPAMKQVLVLDTCAAGAAADSLLARREITGDQIRAIERLKDRTGLHVLMGCAADAKSYEANRYGQGVLTYALLQGMKGGALRDGQFADVSTLFAYASDQVPVLAANLGGVQRPMVMAPRGNSFDIGAFNIDDRAKIPLSSEKMLVGRPLLLNPATVGDPLNLTSSWQARLRQDADANGKWVWVDSADFPGAVIPQGIYTQEGTKIILRLTLWKAGIPSALAPITGDSADIPTLLNAMEDALAKGIQIQ